MAFILLGFSKEFAMNAIVSIRNLTKSYANGFQALKGVSLDIREGEILALLGPNGAGKTTLISIICGLVNPGDGSVLVGGHDVVKDFRQTRALIGLVPQELKVSRPSASRFPKMAAPSPMKSRIMASRAALPMS